MTTYRLIDGASGRSCNGQSAAVFCSPDYLAGSVFRGAEGSLWFDECWWWVCNTSGIPNTDNQCWSGDTYNADLTNSPLTARLSSEISTDPLSSPNEAGATSSDQGTYNPGSDFSYRATYDTGGAPSYWVDVEVTPSSAPRIAKPSAFLAFP
jgi:hypothetical protein